MDCDSILNERLNKLNKLKLFLKEIDDKLLSITKDLNWDYSKLLEEEPSKMVTCSINNQHRVPSSKLKIHEEKCSWHQEGYLSDDLPFSEPSGSGSFVTLTPHLIKSITDKVSTVLCIGFFFLKLLEHKTIRNQKFRSVPKTSANLDQNFSREEKLAIYDYVIANTQNQKTFPDVYMLPVEKKEEKKEMTAWEIAAAERDAKRRRASYRNKVHTSSKSHTEILREVIGVQMEILKEETTDKVVSTLRKDDKHEHHHHHHKKHKHESRRSEEGKKNSKHETDRKDKRDRHKDKNRDRHSKYKEFARERSPSFTGSDSNSRSRSHDKYRKWKTCERRSHSHKSSHSHRKS